MQKPEASKLLDKYHAGEANAEEKALVEQWYSSLDHKVLPDAAEFLEDHFTIRDAILRHVRPRTVRLWPRIAVAAAAVAVITLGTWLYYTSDISMSSSRGTEGSLAYAEDIKPGSVGATLTLANGKTIKLSSATNGELAKEAGVIITKSADGQLIYEIASIPRNDGGGPTTNTLSTAKGETYQVKLPDGTAIWLNAASRLTYSATLNQKGQRRVALEGEAYFQVAKDMTHPFVVQTAGQEVEVLGTHFNINAYPDEPIVTTTLLEGSVRLVSGKADRLLKPGQLAENRAGSVKVSTANIESIMDWKNEEFFLDKLDFRVAMRKISRWYNIEVIYNGSVPENLRSGGWIPRNSKLSDVLKSIEATGQVHFKVEGRKLYVSK